MNRRRQAAVVFGLLVAFGLAALFLLRERVPTPNPRMDFPAAAVVPPKTIITPAAKGSLPAPALDPELATLFTKLRDTFLPNGSKPNRFRIQRQLSTMWGSSPPIDVLLFESTDPSAPPAYRTHFANRLRQLGKMTPTVSGGELTASMRRALDLNPAGGSGLAKALLAIDDSPESIASVSRLLDLGQDDPSMAGFLSALTLSNAPEAKRELLEHTRLLSENPDQHPRSLAVALPTLARIPEFQVEPLLEQVLVATSSPATYQRAIAAAFARTPGASPLAVLQLATDQCSRFDSAAQERIAAQLRDGLVRWQRQPNDLPSSSLQTILCDLP